MTRYSLLSLTLLSLFSSLATAHDVWLEASSSVVRPGDRTDVDVKLGNHGNEHRDFKLAGKVARDSITLQVVSPSGKRPMSRRNSSTLATPRRKVIGPRRSSPTKLAFISPFPRATACSTTASLSEM